MKFKIVLEKDEPLLDRKTVILEIEKESTPTRKEVIELIKAHFGVDVDKFIIQKIEQKFGMPISTVEVRIYENPETLKRLEPKYLIERMNKALASESQEGGADGN
jgi:ribosomal protein S24E